MAANNVKRIDPQTLNLKEQVVSINRVTKVVKGGKNLSFSALVVIGDPAGQGGGLRRGQGQGSAVGHPQGHRSGQEESAQDHMLGTTIPHQSLGRFGSGLVLLKPAPEGTGVIAGGPVRAVITAAASPTC
jgi:small subunit ribosomal protein S5